MTTEKTARVISFSKEQGFGRVSVPDEGELAFDAAVSMCAIDDLIPDAEVLVQTGPSRIAGQRKVTRLWRAGAPPGPPTPLDGVERFESLGPYRFLMPPFWPHESVSERGAIWTSAATLNDAKCVLLVYVGGAKDPKAKTSLVSRGAEVTRTRCDTQSLGIHFEGYRFERDSEVELLYILAAHGDLLTVNCRFEVGNDQAEKLVPLLLTMVAAAAVRRGADAQSPPPEKATFWKRIFGG